MKNELSMTKKDQLFKNGKLRKKTIKDRNYLAWIHSSNKRCIVCNDAIIEAHHVYSNLHGIERSDHLIVCLCSEHHRGSKCSPHGNKGSFGRLFSFEQLLHFANKNFKEYERLITGVCH